MIKQHSLTAIRPGEVELAATISEETMDLSCEAVVLVTERLPESEILEAIKDAVSDGKLASLRLIGDAEAPGIIAQAVYAGHLAGREFGEPAVDGTPFKVER